MQVQLAYHAMPKSLISSYHLRTNDFHCSMLPQPYEDKQKMLPISNDTVDVNSNVDYTPPLPEIPEEDQQSLSPTDEVKNKSRPLKAKKSVKFADDAGKELAVVHHSLESSDEPPKWTDDMYNVILANLKDASLSDLEHHDPIVSLCFQQPISDYMNFRERLNRQNVCLENVMVERTRIKGTVKVRNLGFHKNVFIRRTFDNWQSHTDVHATYLSSNGPEQDSFSFEFDCPLYSSSKLVFTVGYNCEGQEYWDNNDGQNYSALIQTFGEEPLYEPVSFDQSYHNHYDHHRHHNYGTGYSGPSFSSWVEEDDPFIMGSGTPYW